MHVLLITLSLSLNSPQVERQLAVKRQLIDQEEAKPSRELKPICSGYKEKIPNSSHERAGFVDTLFGTEEEFPDLCGQLMI